MNVCVVLCEGVCSSVKFCVVVCEGVCGSE